MYSGVIERLHPIGSEWDKVEHVPNGPNAFITFDMALSPTTSHKYI